MNETDLQRISVPRILIAATGSGAGKTTVTCGIMQALKNRGKQVTAFKCGPDYIDPMFHAKALGTKSRSLDPYFMDENTLAYLLWKNSRGSDIAVMEGVMGYYDGLGGRTAQASTYELALLTKTPVLLVLDGKGAALSLGAQIKGFLEFRPQSGIKGVILNRTSPAMLAQLRDTLTEETGVPVIGCLPVLEGCGIESRHLGLVTADEISNIKEKINIISQAAEKYLDMEALLEIAGSAEPLSFRQSGNGGGSAPRRILHGLGTEDRSVRIGIARDEAFCFYYEDSLDLLREQGATLIPFSPLKDDALPRSLDGILLGGGYPELHGEALSKNEGMRSAVRRAIDCGMPCIAECGGFLYLHRAILDREGNSFPMAGVIPGVSRPQKRLVRFGYAEFTALEDTMLCKKGETIRGHEFHYWDSDHCGESFQAVKPVTQKSWNCIVSKANLFAGFPHFHFYGNPSFGMKFMEACREYSLTGRKMEE